MHRCYNHDFRIGWSFDRERLLVGSRLWGSTCHQLFWISILNDLSLRLLHRNFHQSFLYIPYCMQLMGWHVPLHWFCVSRCIDHFERLRHKYNYLHFQYKEFHRLWQERKDSNPTGHIVFLRGSEISIGVGQWFLERNICYHLYYWNRLCHLKQVELNEWLLLFYRSIVGCPFSYQERIGYCLHFRRRGYHCWWRQKSVLQSQWKTSKRGYSENKQSG